MKAPLQAPKSFGSVASSTPAQRKAGLKIITDNRPSAVAQRKLQGVVQATRGGKGAKKAEKEKKQAERGNAPHPENFNDFKSLMKERLQAFKGQPIHEKFKKDHLAVGHKNDKKDALIAFLRSIPASTIVWGLDGNASREVAHWVDHATEGMFTYDENTRKWSRAVGVANEVVSLGTYKLTTLTAEQNDVKESYKSIGLCCNILADGTPVLYHCNY